jgi:S1-C subfamily serine protease
MIEPLLLTTVRVHTFDAERPLTNASGFFFENADRLSLVTSRHVVIDEPSSHRPDRIEIELHTDADNLAASADFSIPLYRDGKSVWREGKDAAGDVDVATIEIDRDTLPAGSLYRAFTPLHVDQSFEQEIGTTLLVVGFPLGFHDTLHHLPVARQAMIASTFGLRFQGQGYFLTDARTHRGMSGAPVVMRSRTAFPKLADLPWLLLGVHSARLDIGARDFELDEVLGLDCAWYADVLLRLTGPE